MRVGVAKLNEICESHLKGRYRIEVVDLVERPQLPHTRAQAAAAHAQDHWRPVRHRTRARGVGFAQR